MDLTVALHNKNQLVIMRAALQIGQISKANRKFNGGSLVPPQ